MAGCAEVLAAIHAYADAYADVNVDADADVHLCTRAPVHAAVCPLKAPPSVLASFCLCIRGRGPPRASFWVLLL